MNLFTPPSETTTPSHPHPSKTIKRSFDVAFLMAPDEKLAERRQEKSRLRSLLKTCDTQSSLTHDDRQSGYKASAFTKVDTSTSTLNEKVSWSQSGQTTTMPCRAEGFPIRSGLDSYLLQAPTLLYPSYPFPATPTPSLLSSTFAAFGLPAQNVCAKCNVTFRMTSDLVYHMRSHHKGDCLAADPLRRRRDQDKLRCLVCSETFRERHHLTRHMTAHQDKEGD